MIRSALFFLIVVIASGCGSGDAPPGIIHGVNFVGVVVSELDASIELYADAADLAPVVDDAAALAAALASLGVDASGLESRMLIGVNAQLRFMTFPAAAGGAMSPVPVNGPGIAHVCYQVAAQTGAYQRFLAGGSSTIGALDMVALNERNPVEYAYLHDPDGIMVEVEHVDTERLEAGRRPPHQYRVRHVSLATPDMERAVEFYGALLSQPNPRWIGSWFGIGGEKFDRVSGLPGTNIEMAWFQTRNLELEIVHYRSHPPEVSRQPRPLDALGYNMIVFEVGDIEAARERLLGAGGTVAAGPLPLDGGEALFGRDPDGNLLGFQRLPATAVASSQNFSGNGT